MSDEDDDYEPEPTLTAEKFRCAPCGHVGPARATLIYEHHPYGMGYATETLLDDVRCAACGSREVEEMS